MIRKLAMAASAALVVGCGGGDVNLTPTNIDNSVDNSVTETGGGSNNPCANYTDPATNTLVQGTFDGSNCTYDSSFVGATNPLTVDVTLPFISGVHIFQDSLFIGENVDSGAAPAGGTGPTFTIPAGSTLAFLDSADYVLVNRGSQLIADGSPTAPITLTSFSDAVTGTAGPESVQQWGGVIINGNGITNNCTDDQRTNNQCHVGAEGQPSNYGGSDNAESSGIFRYVVVKHTGFEVAPGDEINGVTFNAVGSGTVVEQMQSYSTFDDGFEFFGGAVNLTNTIYVYVRDDSIDFSDGYIGTITNALVIHSAQDGNRCIEGDNIGGGRFDSGEFASAPDGGAAPITSPTINNLTCIMSAHDAGTHDPSEGPTFRRGPQFTLNNALIFAGYAARDLGRNSNECLEITNDLDEFWAQTGASSISDSVIACTEAAKGSFAADDAVADPAITAALNGDTVLNWVTDSATYPANVRNTVINDAADIATVTANASLLEMNSFYTAAAPADQNGTALTFGAAGDEQLGAVTRANDWTAGWSFGLDPNNRAQALWFE